MSSYTVSEVLDMVNNVSERQVQHWAKLGLLPDARPSRVGMSRKYSDADVYVVEVLAKVSYAFGGLPHGFEAASAIAEAAAEGRKSVSIEGISISWR